MPESPVFSGLGATQDSLPPYVRPGPYTTKLPLQEERAFRTWLQSPYSAGGKIKGPVSFDPDDPKSDYDMRGFWKGMMTGDPKAQTGMNASDGKLHFTDYWKTPYHKSFSHESKYAYTGAGAPGWVGDDKKGWKLQASDGRVIVNEVPLSLQGLSVPKRKK